MPVHFLQQLWRRVCTCVDEKSTATQNMVHAMEHLPKTSKEAFLLITECQAQWDEGGKDQM